MDPVTIFQIVGTAVSLGDVVVKCISGLTTFKTKYHDAPVHVSTMIGQLHIVQIALSRLEGWNQHDHHEPRYLQLASQIGNSLESFEVLILALEKHLNQFNTPNPSSMSAKSKMAFIWNEKEIIEYSTLLDRQVNALSLLLQAIQCETWAQQQMLMDREENQSIVSLARDCSTSILGLLDDARSAHSETTANISIMFDFDTLILRSPIYQQAHRSHLREAIRARKKGWDSFSIQSGRDNNSLTDFLLFGNDDNAETSRGPEGDFDRQAVFYNAKIFGDAKSQTATRRLAAPQPPETPQVSVDMNSRRAAASRWNSWLKRSPRRTDSITAPIIAPITTSTSRRILLLGASESGKTTLLRALQLSQEGIHTKQRLDYREIIWSNVILSTQTVLEAMVTLRIPLDDNTDYHHVRLIFAQPDYYEGADEVPDRLGVVEAIETLWQDSGFQNAYKRRREYQLNDSFLYFVLHIRRITAPQFEPTDEDMLRVRLKTTGITDTPFSRNSVDYRVVDPGGRRSERKKWIHVFENVSTVIFTVDAECYGKVLAENTDVNRMDEQVMLFESIANSGYFSKANILTIFTKTDLVEESLQETSVEKVFPDYSRNFLFSPTESYMRYLEAKFLASIRSNEVRERTRMVRANLVDDSLSVATQIWDILEDFPRSRERTRENSQLSMQ